MILLAVIANVLYSTAYAVDAIAFESVGKPTRGRLRTALFIAGTLFALLLATYWIGDEIYPSVESGEGR